jgi:2'-5' RNA ligase
MSQDRGTIADRDERQRLFVAVDPGEQFRRELATRLDGWRQRLRVGWVAPRNWHLTLAFLGDWPVVRLSALVASLQAEAVGHPAFTLQVRQVGAFPDLRSPRVLFLHMDGGRQLSELAAGVRRCIEGVAPGGPQDRKPFRPHLTLARLRRPLPGSQRNLLGRIQLGSFAPLAIAAFHLVRSELRPEGARYSEVATFPLAGEDLTDG